LMDKKQRKATIVLSEENKSVLKAFRNIKNIKVVLFRNLNAYRAFYGGMLVFDGDVFAKKTPKTRVKAKKEKETKKK